MKRAFVALLLTPLLGSATQPPGPRIASEATDVAVLSVRGIGPSLPDRLCVGPRNTIKVELALRGSVPAKPVQLRLVMLLPGGDQAGTLVAEGSVSFTSGATSASFTFLNVDVPARLRGRGALLEVRVNHAGGVVEQNLSNNGGAIVLDEITDWDCR